jgi:hypothetical protein
MSSAELKTIFRCAAYTYEDVERGIPRPEEKDAATVRCEPLAAITAPVVNIRFTIHAMGLNDQRALVIAFRGSDNLENWVGNAMVLMAQFPESWSGSKVHSGNYIAWSTFLKPRVQHELRGVSLVSFNRVIFTGHSLGGAIATLAAADLVSDSAAKWDCDVLKHCEVSVVTFGQPHSGNAAFKLGYDRNGISHKRYVNATDPVPMALAAFNKAAEGAGVKADTYTHVSKEICLAGGVVCKVIEVGEQVYDIAIEFQAHGLTKKALGNALGSHRHALGAYNKAIENHGRSPVAVLAEKGIGVASTVVSSDLVQSTMAKGVQKVDSSGIQGAADASKSMVTQAAGGVADALPLVNVGLGVANLAVGVHNAYHIRKMCGEVREVSSKIDTMRGDMGAGFSETNANIISLRDELDALGDVLELQTYQLNDLTDGQIRTHEMLHALARRIDAGFEGVTKEITDQLKKYRMYEHWFKLKELEKTMTRRFEDYSDKLPVSDVQALQALKEAAMRLMDQVSTQFDHHQYLGGVGDPKRLHLVAHFVFAARTEQDAFLLEVSPPSADSATASGEDIAGGSQQTLASWLKIALGTDKYTKGLEAEVETLQILLAADPVDDLPGVFDSVDMPKLARKALLKALKETGAAAPSQLGASHPSAPPTPAPTQHSTKHLDEALQYIRDEVHGICGACNFNLFVLATHYRPYLLQYLALALGIKEGLALDKLGWDDSDAEAQTGEGKQEEEEEEEGVATLLAKYEEQGALQLSQERTRKTFRKVATVFDVGDDALIERMASDDTLAKLITTHAYTLAETAYACLHLDLYSELVDLFGKKDEGLWERLTQKAGVPFSDVVHAHAETNEMGFIVSFLDRYPSAIRKVGDGEAVDLIVQAVLGNGSAQTESQHVADQSVLLRRLMHADDRNRIMECIVGAERLATSAAKKVCRRSLFVQNEIENEAGGKLLHPHRLLLLPIFSAHRHPHLHLHPH